MWSKSLEAKFSFLNMDVLTEVSIYMLLPLVLENARNGFRNHQTVILLGAIFKITAIRTKQQKLISPLCFNISLFPFNYN